MKFNWEKPELCETNLDEVETQTLSRSLNYKVEFLPLLYLDLPFRGSPRSDSFWQSRKDKIKKNLIGGASFRFTILDWILDFILLD